MLHVPIKFYYPYKMSMLINDLIIYTCLFLPDINKIKYLSLNRNMNLLKDKVFYIDKVNISKIINLWYVKQFTNIFCPKKYSLNDIFDNPITHICQLTFSLDFNYLDIKELILPNLTHLTFGYWFNQRHQRFSSTKSYTFNFWLLFQ